jgi:hypothetical protein
MIFYKLLLSFLFFIITLPMLIVGFIYICKLLGFMG